jgi:dTDP-4-dehydrorhamnose 3,5-epimerase
MITDLPLAGLKLVELKLFHDDRGYFTESYQEQRFHQGGITAKFVQDNCSRSKPGVIRGLHYQNNPAQGKMVGVMRGRVWDVVVDIRSQSSTFGQWYGVELSDANGKMLWVPAGFAHGFCVLGNEDASVVYKVDSFYSAAGEGGIRFDDSDLKIEWPNVGIEPIVSAKDRALPTFAEYAKAPVFIK